MFFILQLRWQHELQPARNDLCWDGDWRHILHQRDNCKYGQSLACIPLHTFLKTALSVVQLVACSHTQTVIGWHNLSLPLIGWHSCLLSVSIPALPPAQASTLHMLSSILLVGATGTNLPSHFVQKIKSVIHHDYYLYIYWGHHYQSQPQFTQVIIFLSFQYAILPAFCLKCPLGRIAPASLLVVCYMTVLLFTLFSLQKQHG